jgi:hypothetical protein
VCQLKTRRTRPTGSVEASPAACRRPLRARLRRRRPIGPTETAAAPAVDRQPQFQNPPNCAHRRGTGRLRASRSDDQAGTTEQL